MGDRPFAVPAETTESFDLTLSIVFVLARGGSLSSPFNFNPFNFFSSLSSRGCAEGPGVPGRDSNVYLASPCFAGMRASGAPTLL
jgi:hypothetical protein